MREGVAASALLTAEERERFASWLEADAASDEMLADAMRRVPNGLGTALIDERLKDVAAKRRIAAQLRATHDAEGLASDGTPLHDAAYFMAEVGWIMRDDGKLYVNAEDLIELLRAGDYPELADDFARIAEEERNG